MTSFDWKRLLKKHSIFSTIRDERKIDALLAGSEEHTYVKDQVIVRQGELGNSLFVIGSGSAEAVLEVGEGEPIPLSTMGTDGVFGEMAFFEKRSRAATVRAKEPCTVLEILGPACQKLVDQYPEIESRLLLMMSERLRLTNEQILALHLKTVDERLKLFSNRLDTEQRVAEASVKAAQAMFDQTKLRAGEVIDSAERSRDRINKATVVMGGVVTILVGLLGLFGFKEVLSMGKLVDEVKKDANDVEAIKKNAEESMKGVQKLQTDLQNSKIATYRTRFFAALDKGSGKDARDAYNEISDEEGLGAELQTLLRGMEQQVVAKDPPLKNGEDVENFLGLFQKAADDAKKPRDKLDAYYLRTVYEYLTGGIDFERARAELEKYVKSTSLKEYLKSTPKEARLRTATPELSELLRKPGKRGEDLRKLSDLAFVSVGSD